MSPEFEHLVLALRSIPDAVGQHGAEANSLRRRRTGTATSVAREPAELSAEFLAAKKRGDAADMSKPGKSERQDGRYKADITAGSLKLAESRRVADLLLQRVDVKGWNEAIIDRNVLQIRSPATAKRMASFIRARLETMGPELWKLVRDGQGAVANHAIFAAALSTALCSAISSNWSLVNSADASLRSYPFAFSMNIWKAAASATTKCPNGARRRAGASVPRFTRSSSRRPGSSTTPRASSSSLYSFRIRCSDT